MLKSAPAQEGSARHALRQSGSVLAEAKAEVSPSPPSTLTPTWRQKSARKQSGKQWMSDNVKCGICVNLEVMAIMVYYILLLLYSCNFYHISYL